MKEKSPQEEKAAVRQVQLINEALNKAKDNGGVWLNKTGMTAPRIYPKGPAVRSEEHTSELQSPR